eukprot:8005235-Lingulodinium_polyedra.AAC.1
MRGVPGRWLPAVPHGSTEHAVCKSAAAESHGLDEGAGDSPNSSKLRFAATREGNYPVGHSLNSENNMLRT